jgi:tRNA (guanine-N7-)-methyltransferase
MELKHIEQLTEILGNARSKNHLEVEIGCGDGHFISSYAKKYDDSFFIGVELKKKRCMKMLKKLETAGLSNVEVIYGRAEDLFASIPGASIDTLHIYFPDPWPKTKHRKKRLIRKPTLDRIAASMKPSGRLLFATDFFDYSVQVKLLLLLEDQFAIIDDDPQNEVFLSVFASRFTSANKPIYFINAVRKSDSTSEV